MAPQIATLWRDTYHRTFRLDGWDDKGRAILKRLDPYRGEWKTIRAKPERLEKMDSIQFDADECLAILSLARGLISRGWCKLEYARDSAGKQVPDSSEDAVSFSADGAICRATYEVRREFPGLGCDKAFLMMRRFLPKPGQHLWQWNDEQTNGAAVVGLFDRAVKDLDAVIARRDSEKQ